MEELKACCSSSAFASSSFRTCHKHIFRQLKRQRPTLLILLLLLQCQAPLCQVAMMMMMMMMTMMTIMMMMTIMDDHEKDDNDDDNYDGKKMIKVPHHLLFSRRCQRLQKTATLETAGDCLWFVGLFSLQFFWSNFFCRFLIVIFFFSVVVII